MHLAVAHGLCLLLNLRANGVICLGHLHGGTDAL